MAKERMITRTISSAEVELTLYDKTTKNTATITANVPRFKTVKELEKYLDSHFNDDTIRWAEILNVTDHDELYGISVSDFLKYAHKITKEGNN